MISRVLSLQNAPTSATAARREVPTTAQAGPVTVSCRSIFPTESRFGHRVNISIGLEARNQHGKAVRRDFRIKTALVYRAHKPPIQAKVLRSGDGGKADVYFDTKDMEGACFLVLQGTVEGDEFVIQSPQRAIFRHQSSNEPLDPYAGSRGNLFGS